jgi:hypothetical protein
MATQNDQSAEVLASVEQDTIPSYGVAGISAQIGETRALIEALAERQGDTETRLAAVDARTNHLTASHARAVQEMVSRIVHDTRNLPTPLTYEMIY